MRAPTTTIHCCSNRIGVDCHRDIRGTDFPPLWRYAPPFLKRRLFYVTDLPFARKTTDTTNEIILLKIRPMAPDAIVAWTAS